jgi:hypothetical protein
VDLIELIFQPCTMETTHNVAKRGRVHVHRHIILAAAYTTARKRHYAEE